MSTREVALYADALLLLTEASYYLPQEEKKEPDPQPAGVLFGKIFLNKETKKNVPKIQQKEYNIFSSQKSKYTLTFSNFIKNKGTKK